MAMSLRTMATSNSSSGPSPPRRRRAAAHSDRDFVASGSVVAAVADSNDEHNGVGFWEGGRVGAVLPSDHWHCY